MNVLLFDIDGTLIDAGGAGQAAMEDALAHEFGARRPVTGISTAGRTDRAIAMDLFQYYELDASEEHWARYQQTYFRFLPDSLRKREGRILPGIPALLERLQTRSDVLLGLLTGNFAEGAQLKLNHYGLAHHFRLGGYGDHHLDRDDVAREAFRAAKQHLPNLEPDRVWVIGDTPSDIRCGRAIGANVLAVGTGMFSVDQLESHKPDVLLSDFSHPDSWLETIGK